MSAKILQFRNRMAHKPLKSKNIPISEEMLYSVRDQILTEMRSLFKNVDAKFAQMESRFAQIDARFEQMESRFAQIDGRFAEMESRFKDVESQFAKVDSRLEKLQSEIHYQTVLIEQQAAENRFVLDGYANLYDRQDRVEAKLDLVLKSLEELKSAKPFGSA